MNRTQVDHLVYSYQDRVHTGQGKVREKNNLSRPGNFEFRHKVGEKSGNFHIYPNMYSTYGYSSLLKMVVKKDR